MEPYTAPAEAAWPGAEPAGSAALKSVLTKLSAHAGAAKKAAELIVPMLSAGNSPRDGPGSPAIPAGIYASGSPCSSGPMLEGGSATSTPTAAGPASPGAGGGAFSAAKKTIGKLFGAGAGAWAGGDCSSPQAGAAASPTGGSGLIAAFRAIIPKTSNGSTGGCLRGFGAFYVHVCERMWGACARVRTVQRQAAAARKQSCGCGSCKAELCHPPPPPRFRRGDRVARCGGRRALLPAAAPQPRPQVDDARDLPPPAAEHAAR